MNKGLWNTYQRQFRRDLYTAMHQPRLFANAILFFVMIVVFFPLTLPPDGLLLKQIAPGLIWMSVVLALLLAAERLFQQDYEQGLIEQWISTNISLPCIILAKITVYWLLSLMPLIIFCPVLALLFHFSVLETFILVLSLLVGTPAIACLCALASAFSTGLQNRGIFMALILLPLVLPIIIFGSSAIQMVIEGGNAKGLLALLGALSLIAATSLPIAGAAVVRISLSD